MQNNYESTPQVQEEGLSFKDLLATIKKHIIPICIFIVAFAAAGFIGAKVVDNVRPSYTANSTIMVGYRDTDTINQSAYTYSNSIAETVTSFIKDDTVLASVATAHNTTPKDLRSNLSISQKSGNLIISLNYTSTDREDAAIILKDIVKSTIDTANVTRVNAQNEDEPVHPFLYKTISLLTEANEDKVSKESHTLKYTAIGAAGGVVVAFIYVFFFEMFNNSFKNKEDIERTLNLPLLGVIPHYDIDGNKDATKGR